MLTENMPVEGQRPQGRDTLKFNPLQKEKLQPRDTVSCQRATASPLLALGPLPGGMAGHPLRQQEILLPLLAEIIALGSW